jgi:hypothetical protein
VTGVQAHADALVAAREVDQLAELLEGAADRVAGAGRVLEQQPAFVGLGERVLHHLAHAGESLVARLAHGRAGVEHDPIRPDLVAHPQRVDQRVG